MPLDDLELEFEDEEEEKKKKRDEALDGPVDLAFEVTSTEASVETPPPSEGEFAEVKKIDDLRQRIAGAKEAAKSSSHQSMNSSVYTSGSSAPMVYDDTKFEARVQVEATKISADYAIELLSDAKLLQHQILQIVLRIHAKHPDLKPELLSIQKSLSEFVRKKRK